MAYNGAEMLAWMRRLVGRRPGATERWRRAVGRLDLDPLLEDALVRQPTLADAWQQCPRVDWAVDLALKAKVEPELIRQGIAEIARTGRGWGAERAPDALDPWRQDTLALEGTLRAIVEAEPEVRALAAKLREAERLRQRARIQTISDQYDGAHARAHRALADAFRRRVTAEPLSVALIGQRNHPYR